MSATENSIVEENKKSLNFIEQIVENDLREGKTTDASKRAFRRNPTDTCT